MTIDSRWTQSFGHFVPDRQTGRDVPMEALRPGDVDAEGDIVLRGFSLFVTAPHGAVWVSPGQAKNAAYYGWKETHWGTGEDGLPLRLVQRCRQTI